MLTSRTRSCNRLCSCAAAPMLQRRSHVPVAACRGCRFCSMSQRERVTGTCSSTAEQDDQVLSHAEAAEVQAALLLFIVSSGNSDLRFCLPSAASIRLNVKQHKEHRSAEHAIDT